MDYKASTPLLSLPHGCLCVLNLFNCVFIYFWLHCVFVAVHGPALHVAHGLLFAVASLVVEHRLKSPQASVAEAPGF